MKTTLTEDQTKKSSNPILNTKIALTTKSNSKARSVRPMKSMVKLRSLKPTRIELGTIRRKPIKA